MMVRGKQDIENRDIEVNNKDSGIYQQWDVFYVDEDYPSEPKNGGFNEDFGLYVGKTFFIVSQMDSNRLLDRVGANMVIKTRNGQNSQKWYFDQTSLTIKNRLNN